MEELWEVGPPDGELAAALGSESAAELREPVAADDHPPEGEEVAELVRQMREGAKEARDQLAARNMGLVHAVARRYEGQGLDYDELVQEGAIGLLRALERYDPERGAKLSTYATHIIRGKIVRALREQNGVIRKPVNVVDDMLRIRRTTAQMAQVLGREPTPEEVAQEVCIPLRKLMRYLGMARDLDAASLDEPVGEDQSELGYFVADPDAEAPEAALLRGSQREWLERLMEESLTAYEREVISLRYGLERDEPRTLQEVADRYGVSREWIRQVERKAMDKLRKKGRKAAGELLE